jgi:CBS-domain-containing membrane protein
MHTHTQPEGKEFFSLKPTDTALYGFQKMAVLKTRALPVLDINGECVATLSSSNLRGLNADTYSALLLPVVDFLKASNAPNASSTIDETELKLSTGVTTTVGAPLSEVLTQLQAYKVHRVWVADEHGKVINAISYTDIFRFFTKHQ